MENKTIGMLMEEAKIELVDCINKIINEKNLPIYLFEYVAKDIYQIIVNQKQQELAAEQQEWMKKHSNIEENKEEKSNAKN